MSSVAPGMGRQPDLAGAGRRRPAGGVSTGLLGDPAGPLCTAHRHAAGAGAPRRGLRVPRPHRAPVAVGRRFFARLAGGHALPGHRPRARCCRASRCEDRGYAGGWWDWLTPFSLVSRRRAHGRLRHARRHLAGAEDRGRAAASGLAASRGRLPRPTLVLIGVFSLWTPLLQPLIMARWFSWPAIIYASARAAAGAGLCLAAVREPRTAARELAPFLMPRALFLLCYIGLGISFYPYIVPPSITIHEAAAPDYQPGLPAGGRPGAAADHSRLHRLRLLDISRQGTRGRRLPLMRRRPRAAVVRRALGGRRGRHCVGSLRPPALAFAPSMSPLRSTVSGRDLEFACAARHHARPAESDCDRDQPTQWPSPRYSLSSGATGGCSRCASRLIAAGVLLAVFLEIQVPRRSAGAGGGPRASITRGRSTPPGSPPAGCWRRSPLVFTVRQLYLRSGSASPPT